MSVNNKDEFPKINQIKKNVLQMLAKAVADNTIQNHLLELQEEEQRDIDEYNRKITPEKLEFYETDPKTQKLLKIYSNFVNKAEGDSAEFREAIHSLKTDSLLDLYVRIKTDEMYEKENIENK